jgi:myo-inositol-1(or 4)-monophosphatase
MATPAACAARHGFGKMDKMDKAGLQDRYDFALALIRDAGALALSYFQRLDELTITSKGLQDMASEADLNTELLIRDRLKRRFPEDGFLGEETGRSELGDSACIWVVDPIDGTQPFICGMTGWCVSIALVVNGVNEMGFVFAPARDELFAGRRGGQAALNGKPVSVKNVSKLSEGILATGYSPRVSPDIFVPFFASLLRDGAMFHREGSGALSLCYVACGRLIGYAELHINSWDCLGAMAVIEAAGGKVSDFLANDGLWKGNRLAAGPPQLFPRIAELVAAA